MFISCLSPCGWCKARRVMVEQAENIWACSRVFRRLRHPWLAETFASSTRGLSWFLWVHTATNNVSWKEHTTLLCLFNDNILICLTAVIPLCRTLLFLNLSGLICRNRQKNINFANDYNNVVNCGSVKQRQREEMTMPCRIYTKGEVLPYRQPFGADIPRASPPVKTALLSTALQAGLWVQGQVSGWS